MAFYAQYHQQPFGSNSHEFNYAAYGWDDQTYLQPTICDGPGFVGYPPQPYQHLNNHTFNPDHLMLHGAASPVKSDFLIDNQLPVLSSTSDSGASIQSSSNMGSPSAQPLQAHEWNQFGLCDNGNPATTYESTTIPSMAKVGCVGEFTSVSSSHNFSFPPSSTHISTGEPWVGYHTGSPSLGTPNSYQTPQVFPRRGSASVVDGMEWAELAKINNISNTAASSVHSFQPRSPVLERVKGERWATALPSPQHMRAKTRLARSSSADGDTERLYAPRCPIKSPFFCQSSGLFVPPLGISRPSPFFRFLFSLCLYGGGKLDRY